jgi:uncharacterized glyoxalase superfamily protein PhnB
MTSKNRSVPVDALLPHGNCRNLEEAMTWLSKAFGFEEHYAMVTVRAAARCGPAKARFR